MLEEVSRWRAKVNQLQEEITRVAYEKENEKAAQASLKVEIVRLTQEIKSLSFYNQEIKQTN